MLLRCTHVVQSNPSPSFSRIGSAEYQGLRPEPKLYMPKTWDELWDADRRVEAILGKCDEYVYQKMNVETESTFILEHARELGQIGESRQYGYG